MNSDYTTVNSYNFPFQELHRKNCAQLTMYGY